MTYTKALVAVAGTVTSAIVAALVGDDWVSPTEWINIAIAGTTAATVLVAPNAGPGGRYTKVALAVVMAVLMLAVNVIADGVSLGEWLQLAVAGLSAAGVYRAGHTPVDPSSPGAPSDSPGGAHEAPAGGGD